ncbi:MAG: glycosyltransferase [Bacteroidota bacterium]
MPQSLNKKRIAFSVTNCICYDQRVQKIAATVEKLDCEITIIGRRLGDCCDSDLVPFKTKRFNMRFKHGFLFYKFFNIRLYFYLLFHKFDLLVANDLDTLLPNFLVSKLKHLPLVYDSHEYFTGVPELNNKPFRKRIWKSMERSIFPHLRHVMTVNDSIATQYQNEYGVRPEIVRNLARSSKTINGYTHKELGINESDILLIFQGAGINIDRGGEELVEAISRTENVTLLIAGAGDVLNDLKEKAESLNLTGQVRFMPKMSWEELMRFTKSSDAGMTLDKDTNLNYRFILPNKLFDYISAGIPVISSNRNEVARIISENNCGIIIPSVTPEEIHNAIIKLRDDRMLLNKLRQNSVKASESLNWESESRKVTEFYKIILSNSTA